MSNPIPYTAQIDPDMTAREVIDNWVNGNLKDAINALKNDHPGLTAVVFAQGIANGLLTRSDVNSIANRLIDARVEIASTGD